MFIRLESVRGDILTQVSMLNIHMRFVGSGSGGEGVEVVDLDAKIVVK